jgi:AcrR family transcriptional regulator
MPHGTAPPPSPESLTPSQFARRERIVKVALNLLVNGDYEKIQMRDVAEGSDVALGTVYRYFTSKEHLFAAVQIEWVKSLHRQILRRPPTGESNLERLSEVLHKSVRAFQTQPQFYRVLLVLEVAKDPFAKELFPAWIRRPPWTCSGSSWRCWGRSSSPGCSGANPLTRSNRTSTPPSGCCSPTATRRVSMLRTRRGWRHDRALTSRFAQAGRAASPRISAA